MQHVKTESTEAGQENLIARERLRIDAACAAKSLGLEKEWAELMAMFEQAKETP